METLQEKKALVIQLMDEQKQLDQGNGEASMDYDMDKMTINQLKERAQDIEKQATSRGEKMAQQYKEQYEYYKNSNSPLTSPDKIPNEPLSPMQKTNFNEDELMKRVESMTYFERLNYMRSAL